MNYVIADVHGEVTKLRQLIAFINAIDPSAELIFIGDYLDKGEDSRATLDFLLTLQTQQQCTFIIGNHEYCWINAAENEDYLLKYGGKHTMASFQAPTVQQTYDMLLSGYGEFFENLVDYKIVGNYFIAHSGVPPEHYLHDLKDIPQDAYLFNRYPFIAQQELFQNKYKVVFGHTGFYMPYIDDYKIGIDTGACYLKEQPLTCFCIETGTFFNSNKETYLLDSLDKSACPNIIRIKPWRTYD